VSHAARVFVYSGLSNGTQADSDNYDNVAPFFLDEKFPENWFRRGDPWTLAETFEQVLDMFLINPRELGANEGLNNFVPFNIDFSDQTPQEVVCFLFENVLDVVPGQLDWAVADVIEAYTGFAKGVLAPLVIDDGTFNCAFTEFSSPGVKAGIQPESTDPSAPAVGSPVDGAYPGIGVVQPGYTTPS